MRGNKWKLLKVLNVSLCSAAFGMFFTTHNYFCAVCFLFATIGAIFNAYIEMRKDD